MKMIMAALTASVLLAGLAAPASAETEMTIVGSEYMQAPSAAAIKRVKMRRYVERQIEYDANKPLPKLRWMAGKAFTPPSRTVRAASSSARPMTRPSGP